MPLPAVSGPAQGAASASLAAPRTSFGAALRAHARLPEPAPAAAPAAGPLRSALQAVEGARGRLDAALAAARAGRTFTAQELLALQSDAYRHAQTFELASKVVEVGAQSVKQAVQTPV